MTPSGGYGSYCLRVGRCISVNVDHAVTMENWRLRWASAREH